MEIQNLLKSESYKTAKLQYEKEYFKLFGEYCSINCKNEPIVKSPSAMKEYFKNKMIFADIEEEAFDKKGNKTVSIKKIARSFYDIWSCDPDMKEYKEMIFECDIKNVKPEQYNLFNNFNHFNSLEKKELDLNPIFDHMKSLVNFNEEHFKYLLSWMAQLIQVPHELTDTCIVIISEEGTGKDLFSDFFSDVINRNYCHNSEKLEQICGKFNSVLGGKLFITINETNPVESRERIENIKFLTTAKYVSIEAKNKDPITSKHYARYIFFSNRLMAFPVENGSRRPVIFKASDKFLKINYGIEASEKHFTKLANILHNKDYQYSFLRFLQTYDIKNFNFKNCSKSELHKELEENSQSPLVSYLADIVKHSKKDDIFRLSTEEALINYNSAYGKKFQMTQTKFNIEIAMTYNVKKLKSCGYMYFEFNVSEIKKMLETKYSYNFENILDELEKELMNNESPLDANITKTIVKEVKDNVEILEQNDKLITKINSLQDNEMKNLMKIQELEMMIQQLKKQQTLSESEINSITNILNF
jgi:hypothetical protein